MHFNNELNVAYCDDKPPTLKEAQQFVGGAVQVITLRDRTQMLINEDGLSKCLSTNDLASALYGSKIVGNIIILSGKALWL